MKHWFHSTTFNFTWDQVAYAFWLRYPNPYSTHVLTEDTVCREIRNDKLYTKRLITKASKINPPRWVRFFMPATRKTLIIEESIVDPVNNTITTYTRNIGLSSIAMIEEKCTYKKANDNRSMDTTTLERECFVTSGVKGFRQRISNYLIERFKKSADQATKGMEHVLTGLYIPESVQETLHINASRFEKLKLHTEKIQQIKASMTDVTQETLQINAEKVSKLKASAKEKAKLAKEKAVSAKDFAAAKVKSKVVVSCEGTDNGSS